MTNMEETKCPTCLGLKVLICSCNNYKSITDKSISRTPCSYCNSTGLVPCDMCKGREMIICPQCEGKEIPKGWIGHCSLCLGNGVVPKKG